MFQTNEFSDMSVNRNLVKYMRRLKVQRRLMLYDLCLKLAGVLVTVTNSNKCGIVNSEFVKSVHWEIISW